MGHRCNLNLLATGYSRRRLRCLSAVVGPRCDAGDVRAAVTSPLAAPPKIARADRAIELSVPWGGTRPCVGRVFHNAVCSEWLGEKQWGGSVTTEP